MFKKVIKPFKYGAVIGTVSGIVAGTGYLYTQFKPKKLVWDLDHTLIHTIKVNKSYHDHMDTPDFKMSCKDDSKERYGYVRPFALCTLKFFSMLALEQNVFTAATRDYAEGVETGAGITHLINETIAREDVAIHPNEIIENLYTDLRNKVSNYYANQSQVISGWPDEVSCYVTRTPENELNTDTLRNFARQKYELLTDDSKQLRTMKLVGKDISAFNFCTDSTEGMILIDDKSSAHKGHENVGILIPRYCSDKKNKMDFELLKVSWTILKCFFTDDVKGTIERDGYSP